MYTNFLKYVFSKLTNWERKGNFKVVITRIFLQLSDVHSDLLGALLEFCYTGQLFIPTGQWQDVYCIASTLQV